MSIKHKIDHIEGGLMSTKLTQANKNKSGIQPPVQSRQPAKDDDLIDLFPLPRYFQVHFEYLHDNSQELKIQLNQLKQSLARVEAKLDRFFALVDNQHEIEQ